MAEMTLEQARDYLERTKGRPANQLDLEKAKEAFRIVQAEGNTEDDMPSLGEWLRLGPASWLTAPTQIDAADFGIATAQPTGVRRPIQVTTAAAGTPGGIPSPAGDGSRLSALSPAFRRRLTEAAAAAGVPAEQVEAIVAGAVQAAELSKGSFTAEMLLEDQTAAWEEAARQARGAPIGVPDSFVASRADPIPAGEGLERFRQETGRPTPNRFTDVEPRYFEGDQFSPAGLDPAEIARIQSRLVETGLLNDGEYWAGFWDAATADSYAAVLGTANQSGRTADQAIDRLIATIPETVKEQRNRAKLAKVFQADPFVKPDKASLAQKVKQTFRAELGRDPRPEEFAEMAAELGGSYRAAYDAQVGADRALFDAEQEGLDTGVPQDPGSFSAVDPVARFQEMFDQRFAPEGRFIEGQADVAENTGNVFESLRTMSSLIG